MTEKISTDVSEKLNNTAPSDDFADYVGIETHLEKLNSVLCLESGGVRMVGIVGTSGIGKSTIARALFNKLSSQFDLRSLKPYKRTLQDRKVADINVKLSWAKQFLSDILCQNDIKIDSLSVVEQRLKHKKVLIILDDVDEKELLETLVGQPGWFGFGSRIIVVTQDRELLKSHKISLVYDVELPSEDLALQMFCRAAFGQNSPRDGFKDLAYEVVKLSGKLPLGVKVLGSTLSEKSEKEWREMLPRLQDGLDSKIERTLRVSYDGLDRKDQDIFLHIACLFNGAEVSHIKNMLGNNALTILADRSLITIRPSTKTVEMHGLLEQLGREIVRAEFRDNPEKRRFLMDAKDILDVLADYDTGTNIVGIHLNTLKIRKTIDEKSFEGMRNLQFLKVYNQEGWNHYDILYLHDHVVYLPPKLRLLHWDDYPAKYLPCSFSGEYLVELIMKNSKLKKLWEGTKPLRSLKKIILDRSIYLKEIPDLSNATNLETLSLSECTSLVELPSMYGCSNLKSLPPDVNLESLDKLSLRECSNLRFFPRISRNISRLGLDGTAMKEEDCLWIENLSRLEKLCWDNCPLRYMPSNFHTEHLVVLVMRYSKLEKLWEGVQPLWSLEEMSLYGSHKLKEIPDLSNATSLIELSLCECTSLVELPSTIRNLKKLIKLDMDGCSNLESLPTDVNLESLDYLDLRGCSSLKNFPRISKTISTLYLDGTAMEEEDCLSIENLSSLTSLVWKSCRLRCMSPDFHLEHLVKLKMCDSKLEKLWEGVQPLRSLKKIILDRSIYLQEIPDLSNATNLETLSLSGCASLVELPSTIRNLKNLKRLLLNRCSNLKSLPPDVKLESLDELSLRGCSNLSFFPRISKNISRLELDGTAMKEEDCLWIENLSRLKRLCWDNCPLRYMPSNFHTEHLVELVMRYSKLEKLWEGVQPLWSLKMMILHGSHKLKEIPDLSNATSLIELNLTCTSLVELPSTIRNLKKLIELDMNGCLNLESLPTDVNLESLDFLNLTGCSSLKNFPRISKTISTLYLDGTAMEEEDCLSIENLSRLTKLDWKSCRLRCMSPDFHSEHLVRLTMWYGKLEKLWEGVQPLGNLRYMDLSGCENLREIPDLSKANNLEGLILRDCTSLEDLPTNIDLVSLIGLDLIGCSRLKRFPQFSTSIKYLYLDYTAIKEIPSWIENMSGLEWLSMKGCEILKISAKYRNLRHFYFTECGSQTAVSNANLAKLLAELHPASIQYYTQEIISSSDDTEFLLARGAQELILQRNFRYAIVPGKQVPRWYFKHQNRGSSLTVPLPQSSQQNLEFAGCIILGRINLGYATDHITIFVHWKFRGVKGISKIKPCIYRDLIYHQIVFHFDFNNGEEVDGPPSQFDCNNVEFEFEVHNSLKDCCCYKIFGTDDRNLETCPIFPQMIEECGIRVLSVISSLDANETEDNPQDGEESDGRMRMTVKTSQEPSSSLCGETAVESGLMAPSMELSLGLCGASDHVSSISKVPWPSIPSSNLHGDGPSLSLSLTPDPCLAGETLHSNPMLTDQQDTEPFVDPLSSPHIINFFCQTPAPDFDHSSVSFHDDWPLLSPSLTPSDTCLAGETLHSKPMITDQRDTETPFVDPSSSPQLINFFSQNLLPNLDLTSSLGGSSSNFHGDGTSPCHSLSPFHPCCEEQALYVDPMTTEQLESLDRGGTNCQSFILFTASKLFQILEITFRQVSNLFCGQTGDSFNSVPSSSYSTLSNAPELFVFSSSGNSRVAEDKRLYKKVVKKQKIPKRNVFSSPRLKHTACVMIERTHTRENLEKVVVSA